MLLFLLGVRLDPFSLGLGRLSRTFYLVICLLIEPRHNLASGLQPSQIQTGLRFNHDVKKTYRKFPKYSDPKEFVVITLKFELCGSTIE